MKRILHVISTLEQGGTEAVVLNYFNHIDKEKVMFDFLVIWGENKGFHEDYLLSMGCRIFKMHNGPDKFFAHGKELKSFFQNQKYDVVHIHAMSSLRYRVAKVAKKNGVKTVIYHSHNSYNGSHLLIHKLLKGRLNRWCDYKFACSDAAGRYMYNGSFHKINNAIDIEHFSFNEDYRNELRHQYNLEDKFIIGNIGRFTEVKNQQFLLKLSAYIESRIDNYVIFCIGEGEQRENLSNYIKDNKLERNVILSGTVGMEAYLFMWVLGFIFVGVMVCAQDFMTLLTGDSTKKLSYLSLTLIMLSFYLTMSRQMTNNFKECAGLFWNDRLKPIFEAGMNLGLDILLVHFLGLNGVILATIISTILIPLWVEPFVLYKQLWGIGLAANAQLNSNQYHIYLCEDGGGTYSGLRNHYMNNKVVNATNDQPYETMVTDVNRVKSEINDILSKTDNTVDNLETGYYIAFPLATMDNVSFLIQDDVRIKNYLEELGTEDCRTKLLSAIGFDGYNEKTDINLNIEFGSISDRVDTLDATQKESYLKLMYGKYYDDTYKSLTRTTLSDNTTAVPDKKLVFISSRVKSYPSFAADFGYIDVTSASQVPDSYADLDAMYKTDFLFGTEEDYKLLIDQLNLATNYNDDTMPEQSVLDAIRVDCFNYYLDYLVTLKFTYHKYGSEFDIILKGHPSEVLGEHGSWTQHYDAGGYRYDKLYDNLLLKFHESDSIGKFIGLVPFGTAAENLAYLGADISLCGLPSSTYTGYDQSIDIKFIMARVNTAIDKDNNLNGRYAAGTLLDHDVNGQEVVTSYFNVGNLYKQLIEYYSNGNTADAEYKAKYEEKLAQWLRSVNGLAEDADVTGYDVDAQGFLIIPIE